MKNGIFSCPKCGRATNVSERPIDHGTMTPERQQCFHNQLQFRLLAEAHKYALFSSKGSTPQIQEAMRSFVAHLREAHGPDFVATDAELLNVEQEVLDRINRQVKIEPVEKPGKICTLTSQSVSKTDEVEKTSVGLTPTLSASKPCKHFSRTKIS